MEKASNYRIVFVSCDSFNVAERIAKNLISEKLAACCSIIPNVYSIYQWDGNIQKSNEYMIMIKTSMDMIEDLEKRIFELHNYEVPEILSISVEEGSKPYLDWMKLVI